MSTYPIIDAFAQFRREIAILKMTDFKAFDLGPKQVTILYRLTLSNATMGELADYSVSDKASTTRTVAALEAAGYVKRIPHETDRRVIVIQLTAKGKTKASQAIDLRQEIGDRVSATLTQAEQKTLSALLNKAAAGLRTAREKKSR